MNEYPLVTVNILSFNRKDELRNNLTKVYEQDYKNIEVIVVDNASGDGSSEMVKKEFPGVQVIQLEKNIGIAGWNEGFKAAKGEYVLVLDDDSYPTGSTIKVGIKKIIDNPNVAIIACKIVSDPRHKPYNESEKIDFENFVNSFTGCGAIIRKSVLEKVGGFEKELFIYFHEVEFSIRVIDAGWNILFCPTSIVIHNFSIANRLVDSDLVDSRKVFYDVRNLILIIYIHFPLTKSVFLIVRIILGRILYGFLEKKLNIVLSALKSAFSRMRAIKSQRKTISDYTQKQYLNGSFAGGFFFFNSNYGLRRPKWMKQN